ncbi:hypothetical protein PYCCODRAFT_1468835 [Trametes coccinea BRFM310]|uniref:Uncharacterized protein n=1 Tax=Trametes coccinea (strain BRFM310) TaxID=1353009 RepID=A0A1Y2IMG6_TRAC3|nr:hypothetical protein PYCCODRAFT_1468835 [Trametes coccinea BRFM310]
MPPVTRNQSSRLACNDDSSVASEEGGVKPEPKVSSEAPGVLASDDDAKAQGQKSLSRPFRVPITRSESFQLACKDDSLVASEPDAASRLEEARARTRANSNRYMTAHHLWSSHAFYGEEELQALHEEYTRRIAEEEERFRAPPNPSSKAPGVRPPGDPTGTSNPALAAGSKSANRTADIRGAKPVNGREPSETTGGKRARKQGSRAASSRSQKRARVDGHGLTVERSAQDYPGKELPATPAGILPANTLTDIPTETSKLRGTSS